MLRLLALKLSALGYYVMRFDYRGTGDSSGDFAAADMTLWAQDLLLALDELQALSNTSTSHIVAVRAATLLLGGGIERSRLAKLLLWDPCLKGADFLADLNCIRVGSLSSKQWYSRLRFVDELLPNEYVGYNYSHACLQQLQAADVREPTALPAREVVLLSTAPDAELKSFSEKLKAQSITSELFTCDDMGNWSAIDQASLSLTSNKIILEICRRLA